jgi:hypothetical protein
MVVQKTKCFQSIARFDNLMPFRFQNQPDGGPNIRIVIDQQNAQGLA